jgi:hypothetical protein
MYPEGYIWDRITGKGFEEFKRMKRFPGYVRIWF